MDNYLIDRGTLEKFVDELIKKRTLPVNTAEEINAFREKMIKQLDDEISLAIFGSLNKEQLDEINRLMERDDSSEDTFRNFFKGAGIDVEKVITDTAQAFGEEYLGGKNV